MKHFNYQDCTVEELADHVEATRASIISTMLAYYKKADNKGMIDKIASARKIVAKRKLQAKLESM